MRIRYSFLKAERSPTWLLLHSEDSEVHLYLGEQYICILSGVSRVFKITKGELLQITRAH